MQPAFHYNSGVCNFEVASRFLENLCTPALSVCYASLVWIGSSDLLDDGSDYRNALPTQRRIEPRLEFETAFPLFESSQLGRQL